MYYDTEKLESNYRNVYRIYIYIIVYRKSLNKYLDKAFSEFLGTATTTSSFR